MMLKTIIPDFLDMDVEETISKNGCIYIYLRDVDGDGRRFEMTLRELPVESPDDVETTG